jgi:hydrogenase 3 maturation protease
MGVSDKERFEQCLNRRPVLIGIGSRWHADDAAGPAVVSRVSGLVAVRCIDAGDAPERHLGEAIAGGADAIVLLDAVDFGGEPGEIAVLTAAELPDRLSTTHTSSLRLLMRYLATESDADVLLVGIQPAQIIFGQPMTEAVRAAVDAIAALLIARLGRHTASVPNPLPQIAAWQTRERGQDHTWR